MRGFDTRQFFIMRLPVGLQPKANVVSRERGLRHLMAWLGLNSGWETWCPGSVIYKREVGPSGFQGTAQYTSTNMFSLIPAFYLVVLAATSVNAHGYVQDVVIGSTHYTGYLPYSDPYYNPPPERIIHAIPGNGTSYSPWCHSMALIVVSSYFRPCNRFASY